MDYTADQPADPARAAGPDLRASRLFLRRLARAHASGELCIDDFRRRRRELVEAWCADGSRTREDITVRRSALAAPGDTKTLQEPSAPRRQPGWRWLLVMPLSVALLVTLITDGAG